MVVVLLILLHIFRVHVIVTTTGGIEEDLIKCLAPTYKGDFSLPGAHLRSKGLNRIGNLLVPNDNYCKFEDWIIPIFNQMLKEQNNEVFYFVLFLRYKYYMVHCLSRYSKPVRPMSGLKNPESRFSNWCCMVRSSRDFHLKNDVGKRYLYSVIAICSDISCACLLRNSFRLLYTGRELIVFYKLCSY
jgi:hypothetical protein